MYARSPEVHQGTMTSILDRLRRQREPRDHEVLAALTFDIFDTLLVRRVGDDQDVFVLLGRRLSASGPLHGIPAGAISVGRVSAERRARAWRTGKPATLAQIWGEFCHAYGLSPDMTTRLAAEEVRLEAELASRVEGPWRELLAARATGRAHALISDTSLSVDELREVLRGAGIDVAGTRIFSSSVEGVAKGSGRLFTVVAEELGVPVAKIRHVGNYHRADVEGARLAGAVGRLIPDANATRFEKALSSHAESTGGLGGALAGAARLARLTQSSSSQLRPIREVAAGVAGPLLVGFTIWLLQRAERAEDGQIFFLARDGQVVHQIARILGPQMGWDKSRLNYLHVSRRVLNATLLDPRRTEHQAWIWPHPATATGAQFLERSGLSESGGAQWLRDAGVADSEQHLSPWAFQQLVESFANDDIGQRGASERAHLRAKVQSYLEQEGFYADTPVAVVDSAGHGSQFQALASERQQRTSARTSAFYIFRLEDRSQRLVDADEHGWLFDRASRFGHQWPANITALTELMSHSDEGSVRAYEHSEGRIVPLKGEPPQHDAEAHEQVRSTVIEAARHMLIDPELVALEADAREAILDVIQMFWEDPTPDEVEAWGGLRAEFAGRLESLALPIGVASALRFTVTGSWLGPWWQWPAGSLAKSNWAVRRSAAAVATGLGRKAARRIGSRRVIRRWLAR